MFLNLFRTDLLKGYWRILNARQNLLRKWRFEILRAYTHKWDVYAKEIARRETRRLRFQKRVLPWMGVVLLLLAIGGLWMSFYGLCAGPLLMVIMLLGVLAAMGTWFAFILKPAPPVNPLAQYTVKSTRKRYISPIKNSLFPNPIETWEVKLSTRVPTEEEVDRRTAGNGKYGEIGEFALIRGLERVVSPDTFLLHSLMPKPRDDMDVVVIGTRGLWYFEVKHNNAIFEWEAGTWHIRQYDNETRKYNEEKWREYPDAQRSRMMDEMFRNPYLREKDLPRKAPVIKDVRGGIVFSNKNAKFKIHPSASFMWGNVPFWVDKYRNAPRLKEMTPEVIYRLTDILTRRHQELNPTVKVLSTDAYAVEIMQEMEMNIQKWISAP